MVVDTSALVAIVFQEPGYELLLSKLEAAGTVIVGAPTLAETAIVLGARLNIDSEALVARLAQEFGLGVAAFGDDHWREAALAYRQFGRGQHPAQLNFGDCLTYATCKLANQALLFVGDDFSKTDLNLA